MVYSFPTIFIVVPAVLLHYFFPLWAMHHFAESNVFFLKASFPC